jgi:hypothetical protein
MPIAVEIAITAIPAARIRAPRSNPVRLWRPTLQRVTAEAKMIATPADVYFGRQHEILSKRGRIKRSTMNEWKRLYRANQAA